MRADVIVLCYHAVSDAWRSSLAVTPERLEAQVASLLRRGYRPQTFTAAVLEPAARRVVAVTFDDAYRSVLRLAAPVLERLGAPATVFAPTAFVGSAEPMSWPGIDEWLATEHRDELVPLDWDELRALAARGWEVGSHTVRHPRLTSLDAATLDRELRDSRAACERELAAACTAIAYPYGDVDRRVAAAAGAAGYRAGGTLPRRLHAAEPLCFPRVGLYQQDEGWRLRAKTSPAMRRLRASRAWTAADGVRRGLRAGAARLR